MIAKDPHQINCGSFVIMRPATRFEDNSKKLLA